MVTAPFAVKLVRTRRPVCGYSFPDRMPIPCTVVLDRPSVSLLKAENFAPDRDGATP
jgi:hypothetical protein